MNTYNCNAPLWLPFGEIRNKVVDEIISMKRLYPDYIVNTEKQISLMKGNWGGIGTTPVQCPSWAILSLDHMGRVKQPCCIGSANNKELKPNMKNMVLDVILYLLHKESKETNKN